MAKKKLTDLSKCLILFVLVLIPSMLLLVVAFIKLVKWAWG